MSSSRENSPDWLHSFQAPTRSLLTLSSESESPLNSSPTSEDDEDDDYTVEESSIQKSSSAKTPNKKLKQKSISVKSEKRKKLDEGEGSQRAGKPGKRKTPEKSENIKETKHSILTLSSDSESCRDFSPPREDLIPHEVFPIQETGQNLKMEEDEDAVLFKTSGESSLPGTSKLTSPKKKVKVGDTKTAKTKGKSPKKRENDSDMDVAEEETTEKQTGHYVSTSSLPLVLSDKVQRSKALVECEDENIDLSGDLGSVGRVVISDTPSGSHEMLLDLKGTIYRTSILPSATFCVVSLGQSEAKIEAIMNDFIQLKAQSNVYEAETMIEGTLEGFSFDSEDEADKLPHAATNQADENDGEEQQTNGKARRKTEKTSGTTKKKGKAAVKKPPKKVKRKPQVSKKTKTKK